MYVHWGVEISPSSRSSTGAYDNMRYLVLTIAIHESMRQGVENCIHYMYWLILFKERR